MSSTTSSTDSSDVDFSELDKAIIEIVEKKQFIKIDWLLVMIPKNCHKFFKSGQVMNRILALVKEGKFQEIEYTNKDFPYRTKSLFVSNKISFKKDESLPLEKRQEYLDSHK